MNKNKKNLSKQKIEKKSNYKNPMDTVWGKLIVWLLIISMLGAIVIGVIYALITLI